NQTPARQTTIPEALMPCPMQDPMPARRSGENPAGKALSKPPEEKRLSFIKSQSEADRLLLDSGLPA
ncbi:MAG: hypothetical protein ACE5ID_09590, partial [Acidobacteriota bacterium]